MDIAKIILAAEGRDVPQTYKETLRSLAALYFDSSFTGAFASYADLRNLIAHEYLDYRWESIHKFIASAETIYPRLIEKIKTFVE